jgi:membrane protein
MWQAKGEKRPGFIGLILYRLISVVLVSVVSILFIVSFSLSAFINTATELIRDIFPVPGFLLESTNFVLTAFGITLIFSIIYIFLIEAKVRLKDILAGSAVAAFLFTLGKTLISFYLGFSNILTLFGAASSFIALLILIYYSVQFFFIGAEVVKVLHKKNKRR